MKKLDVKRQLEELIQLAPKVMETLKNKVKQELEIRRLLESKPWFKVGNVEGKWVWTINGEIPYNELQYLIHELALILYNPSTMSNMELIAFLEGDKKPTWEPVRSVRRSIKKRIEATDESFLDLMGLTLTPEQKKFLEDNKGKRLSIIPKGKI